MLGVLAQRRDASFGGVEAGRWLGCGVTYVQSLWWMCGEDVLVGKWKNTQGVCVDGSREVMDEVSKYEMR